VIEGLYYNTSTFFIAEVFRARIYVSPVIRMPDQCIYSDKYGVCGAKVLLALSREQMEVVITYMSMYERKLIDVLNLSICPKPS
jgi:hypothetical protein